MSDEKVGTLSKCAYIDGKKRDDAIDLRKKSCQLPFVFQKLLLATPYLTLVSYAILNLHPTACLEFSVYFHPCNVLHLIQLLNVFFFTEGIECSEVKLFSPNISNRSTLCSS